MKKLLQILTVGIALASATSLQALTLSPTAPTDVTYFMSGNQTGTSEILAYIASQGITLTEQYKRDVGKSDTGNLKNSYDTTFLNTATDPEDAVIRYVAGPVINTTQPIYLLVKDGNQTPAWYLFNLTGAWNGTDTLYLNDFWPNQGAISHVSLYGGTGTQNVPDGGTTLTLLGLGLTALGMARSRFVRK